MSASTTKRVDRIFKDALKLPSSDRAQFLIDQCGNDGVLLDRIKQLLAAADFDDDRLNGRVAALRQRLLDSMTGAGDDEELTGQQIGHWRVEAPLARGGLATVYLAHRDDGEFDKRAALKVLRRGLDTDDVIARFRAERQILSSLDHPAIAQMFDGGGLPDGRPYLVLEYVDGMSITQYCDVKRVGIRGRVKLIIDTLKALQHAHNHLVVHRDIKPSNILVSNEGRIKVLDFGIAKLLDPAAIPGGSTMTRTGFTLLTPVYGSPEQHANGAVTTASDIYQVGAVLYELLAGQRPPSGATVTLHSSSSKPSHAIRGTPNYRKLKGDLDAIVSKAMQTSPGLRYVSATDMLADLERYLDGWPVQAQPDTPTYRFYKLLRRRPLLLPALTVSVVFVSAFIVTQNIHSRELRIEQERTSAAQTFMLDILGSASPYGSNDRDRGKDILVVDALDVGLQRLRTNEYGADAKLRAALLSSIANVYANLDKHNAAINTRLEAVELERALHGDISRPVMLSLRELGHQYRTVGNYAEAASYYDEQLAIAKALYGSDAPEVALANTASGLFLFRRGDLKNAELLLQSAVDVLAQRPRENTDDYINALVTLARVRNERGLEETLSMLGDARELADDVFGPFSPTAGLTRTQLATSQTLAGDYAAAEKNFDDAIGIYEAKLGRDHGATLIALINLGRLYFETGRWGDAELTFREVSGHYFRKYGATHRGVAESSYELGMTLIAQGRFDEAVAPLQQAYESSLAVLGDEHIDVFRNLIGVSRAQFLNGDLASGRDNAALGAAMLFKAFPASGLLKTAECLLIALHLHDLSASVRAEMDAICFAGNQTP